MSLPLAVYDPDSKPDQPIAATFESFLNTCFLPTIADRTELTIQKYRDTAQHWQNAVGDIAPALLNDAHGQIFYRYLERQPGRCGNERLSDITIKGHITRMWHVLQLAVKKKILAELPERPTRRVDYDKLLPRYWINQQELETLLSFCHAKLVPRTLDHAERAAWWRALLYTVWWTAARIHQVLGLRWDDLNGDVLTIRPTQKRARLKRYVVLNRRAVELLSEIKRKDDLIFSGLGPHTNLAKHFHRLCHRAGIKMPPGNAWHTLRRGKCAMEFQKHGLEWAQEQLGHADRATTEQFYLDEMVRRQVSIDRQRAFLTSDDFEPADVPAKRPAKTAADRTFKNRVEKHLHYARELFQAELYDESALRCRRAVEAWLGRWIRRRRLHVGQGATLMDRVLLLRQFEIIDTEAVRLLRYALPKMSRAAHDNKSVSAYAAGEILMHVSGICGSDDTGEFAEDEAATRSILDELNHDKIAAMEADYERDGCTDVTRLVEVSSDDFAEVEADW